MNPILFILYGVAFISRKNINFLLPLVKRFAVNLIRVEILYIHLKYIYKKKKKTIIWYMHRRAEQPVYYIIFIRYKVKSNRERYIFTFIFIIICIR